MNTYNLGIAGAIRQQQDRAAIGIPERYQCDALDRLGFTPASDIIYIRDALTCQFGGPNVQHFRRLAEGRLRDEGLGYLLNEQPE